MYKYSKKAQEKFFQSSFLAYLYVWFAESGEGQQFIHEKIYKQKGAEYNLKIQQEINDLKGEAVKNLKKKTNQNAICMSLLSNLADIQKKKLNCDNSDETMSEDE